MSAVDVMENLIKLGTIAANEAEKYKKNGKFDYSEFTNSAPKEIMNAVKDILNALKPNELRDALTTVEQKQRDLLAGRQLHELSTDKLVQYSALTDSKLLIQTAMLKRSIEGDFFTWLVDDGGLANIIKIVQVVIPLLV